MSERIAGPAEADPIAFYAAGYALDDAAQAARYGRWRELGARGKAAHVAALLARRGVVPETVVELGCGDGALLAALAARGIGTTLDGFELSAPAAALAAGRGIPGARRIEAFDGVHVPAADGAYDLAVLSHVVEHVPDPVPLLAEAARIARWVLVEVPLEANRSAARPAKRAEAARIGHLHALDRAELHRLCREAGLTVCDELSDPLPLAHHAFFADTRPAYARAAAKAALRRWVWRISPRKAAKLFTLHDAVLARPLGPR
jgi:SAM-dependent methyltransferase